MKKSSIFKLVLLVFMVHFMYGNIELIEESQGQFSRVVQEGINYNQNPMIQDIALLGAHDAFSHDIQLLSPLDPGESPDALVSQTPLRFLIGGVFVRYAKAQTVGTQQLLERGVRYFDVRVSFHDDQWVTKHGLISNPLHQYLLPMVSFLNEHPGEFVILDFQHVYLANQTYSDLIASIELMKVNNQSLFDFIHYSTQTPIHELTYDDVTQGKTQGGVLLLLNTPEEESHYHHYSRIAMDGNIRSNWHNTANLNTLMSRIQEEHLAIQALPERTFLSVNQAQRTSDFSLSGITDTLLGWSLITMAKESNARLMQEETWMDWFETMPILMVDFATSNHQGFNVLVNEAMIEYNLTL
jgi:hypothetical protein